jgi:hypothetical protein
MTISLFLIFDKALPMFRSCGFGAPLLPHPPPLPPLFLDCLVVMALFVFRFRYRIQPIANAAPVCPASHPLQSAGPMS